MGKKHIIIHSKIQIARVLNKELNWNLLSFSLYTLNKCTEEENKYETINQWI